MSDLSQETTNLPVYFFVIICFKRFWLVFCWTDTVECLRTHGIVVPDMNIIFQVEIKYIVNVSSCN